MSAVIGYAYSILFTVAAATDSAIISSLTSCASGTGASAPPATIALNWSSGNEKTSAPLLTSPSNTSLVFESGCASSVISKSACPSYSLTKLSIIFCTVGCCASSAHTLSVTFPEASLLSSLIVSCTSPCAPSSSTGALTPSFVHPVIVPSTKPSVSTTALILFVITSPLHN